MDQQLQAVIIAEELVRVIRELPGVADVYSDLFGSIATYGRGRRVPGIRVRTENGRLSVEVHIIANYAPDLDIHALARAVRSQIKNQLLKMNIGNMDTGDIGEIDVVVDDIRVDAAPQPTRKA